MPVTTKVGQYNICITSNDKNDEKVVLINLLFSSGGAVLARTLSESSQIPFQVNITDPTKTSGDFPRTPMRPPVVYIEDYTLSFVADHPDYVLTIKDEDGDVVYTTTVFSTETQVTLPSTLSGDYQIELTMGNWLFTGWISL